MILDAENASIKLTVVVEEAAAAIRLAISPKSVRSGRSATLSGSI